ncbi:MAG: hypothetical protein K1Y01_20675 [Vicinamibacteria bacterium]|nr:hypothetical protein [Vicinamibacteria bacterium]
MYPNHTPSNTRRSRAARAATLLAALTLCCAHQAKAEDWRFTLTPYAWMAGLGVDVSINDRQVLDKKISFTDLIKDVDMVAQGRAEAQRGAHGVAVDLFNVQLSKKDIRPAKPVPGAVLDTDVSMTLLDVTGIFDPHGDRQGLSIVYGARLISQSAAIDVRNGTAEGVDAQRHDVKDTVVDGLVGLRFGGNASRKWSYLLAADVSTGGTKFTWSGGATVAYTLDKGGRYALTAGYRYMSVRFDGDSQAQVDMTLSGFSTGFRMSF